MAEITDIVNEFIRDEIEEFLEREDERERAIATFAEVTPNMQAIAAALIDGDHHEVDALTKAALDAGTVRCRASCDALSGCRSEEARYLSQRRRP